MKKNKKHEPCVVLRFAYRDEKDSSFFEYKGYQEFSDWETGTDYLERRKDYLWFSVMSSYVTTYQRREGIHTLNVYNYTTGITTLEILIKLFP